MNRRIIQWIVLGICIAGIAVLAVLFRQQESAARCTGVEITIDGVENKQFVTRGEMADFLFKKMGEIKGRDMDKISLKKIEETIGSHPMVRSTEVYTNLEHKIQIHINQHQALVRIHPDKGNGYYLSDRGSRFPLSAHYTERVVVATGSIDTTMSRKVYTLVNHVHRLPFWNAQIEQIFVGEEGDLILIEKFGNHRLIIGDTDNLDEKLERLEAFYKKALQPKGWGRFTTINAKYNNQIICK